MIIQLTGIQHISIIINITCNPKVNKMSMILFVIAVNQQILMLIQQCQICFKTVNSTIMLGVLQHLEF